MTSIYVKPREGARVRQPDRNGRVMPAAGEMVPRDGYYTRLIIGGDLVECDAPQAPQQAGAAPPDETPDTPADASAPPRGAR